MASHNYIGKLFSCRLDCFLIIEQKRSCYKRFFFRCSKHSMFCQKLEVKKNCQWIYYTFHVLAFRLLLLKLFIFGIFCFFFLTYLSYLKSKTKRISQMSTTSLACHGDDAGSQLHQPAKIRLNRLRSRPCRSPECRQQK